MILFDQHIHTHYSKDADGDATFQSYILRAQELGFTSLTFTDHHDIDPAHELFKIPIDYDAYIKDFLVIKKQAPIPIKLGVEIGYQSHVKADIQSFIAKYPFDYVILSVHYMEKKDLYTGAFFVGKTKDEAYSIYFKTCLEAIETIHDFDAFGHLDYIPRYAPYEDYTYETHKDIIDEILLSLIKKNKSLEINTSGFKTENRMYPKMEVIERYVALGGHSLTVGSDAHHPRELGLYFDRIPQKIREMILYR